MPTSQRSGSCRKHSWLLLLVLFTGCSQPQSQTPVNQLVANVNCEAGSLAILKPGEKRPQTSCPAQHVTLTEPAPSRQLAYSDARRLQKIFPGLELVISQPAYQLLGSLEPKVAIMTLWKSPCKPEQGILFVGGHGAKCLQLLIQAPNRKLRLIQDQRAFRAYFTPIRTPAAAASYAMARSGNEWWANFSQLNPDLRFFTPLLRPSHVEHSKDAYQVLLYDSNSFGPGPHPVYAVTYRVTTTGSFSEIKREKAWEDPHQDTLIAD